MNRLVFFLLVFLSIGVSAQNFDNAMRRPLELGCDEITVNSSYLFADYIDRNEIDSAAMILDYWTIKCGRTEPVYRAKIILYLVQNKNIDPIIDSSALDYIEMYRYRIEKSKTDTYHHYEKYIKDYGYLPFNSKFDSLTKKIALQYLNKVSTRSVDYLFCEFYGGVNDSIFYKIQHNDFKGTNMAIGYYKFISMLKSYMYMNLSISGGAWIPTGSMKKFGIKPLFGFNMELEKNNITYKLNAMVRFGNSNVIYQAKNKETNRIESTNEFSGANVGFDVGWILLRTKKADFKVQAGLGLDFIDVFPDKDTEDNIDVSTTLYTYNFNLGLGYRYHFKSTFLELNAKYHFVDYRLGNIVDFSANPITIYLSFGIPGFNFRDQHLSYDQVNYLGVRR